MRHSDLAVILLLFIVLTSSNALATAQQFSCFQSNDYSETNNWLEQHFVAALGLSCKIQ